MSSPQEFSKVPTHAPQVGWWLVSSRGSYGLVQNHPANVRQISLTLLLKNVTPGMRLRFGVPVRQNFGENRIPFRPFNNRTLTTFIRECSIVKGSEGDSIFKNRIPFRPFNNRTLTTFIRECSIVKGSEGDYIFKNRIPFRPFNNRTLTTFIRECSIVKGSEAVFILGVQIWGGGGIFVRFWPKG